MNFVDTAITLLQEAGKPLAAETLCDLAIERGLLDKPGANPLRSMKTRLTVELKKGEDSRVQKNDDEAWVLHGSAAKAPAKAKKKASAKAKAPAKAKASVKAKAATKTKAAPKTKAATKAKAATKTKSAAAKSVTPKAKASAAKKTTSKAKAASEEADEAKPVKAAAKKTRSRKSKNSVDTAAAKEAQAEETPAVEPEIVEPAVVLTPEEQALVDLYSEDSSGTRSVSELNEYRDNLTKDEDRLMLPEIKAERKSFRRDRGDRDRPRQRRSRRGREGREGREGARSPQDAESRNGNATRATSARVSGDRDISGTPISVVSAPGIARERITRSALQVLSALPPGQSMPVRQLTQTMIRRDLLEGKADRLWRMVKGVLLVSEQRRSTRGLLPLVRYHGKDLFSAGQEAGRSHVDVAATALQRAAEDYAAAVESETLDRLSRLAPAMLERIAYIYLQSAGWTEIEWIKRVGNSSYALAAGPGAVDQSMIAVRSGPEKVDRRGVGELRAGLHAKGIASGVLISPCGMSEEADLALAEEGTPLRIICGSDFVSELVAREVGVTWRHIQLPQIDQRFYDAVLS